MKSYSHPSLEDVTLPLVMQALSDPCRIAIIRAIESAGGGGELACNAVPLKISKATRSHHFSVLREVGLIFTRCDGTKCMTSIRRGEFEQRFPGLLSLVLAPTKTGTKKKTEKGVGIPKKAAAKMLQPRHTLNGTPVRD